MIEAGLFTRLNAEVGAVGGRIYPKKLPQNVTYPALTYEAVSDPRLHTHGGTAGMVEARYQITPWSASYLEAKQVADQVREALDGFSGTLGDHEVQGVRHQGGRDLFDQDAGQSGIYHIPTDYMIPYREEVPA